MIAQHQYQKQYRRRMRRRWWRMRWWWWEEGTRKGVGRPRQAPLGQAHCHRPSPSDANIFFFLLPLYLFLYFFTLTLYVFLFLPSLYILTQRIISYIACRTSHIYIYIYVHNLDTHITERIIRSGDSHFSFYIQMSVYEYRNLFMHVDEILWSF